MRGFAGEDLVRAALAGAESGAATERLLAGALGRADAFLALGAGAAKAARTSVKSAIG